MQWPKVNGTKILQSFDDFNQWHAGMLVELTSQFDRDVEIIKLARNLVFVGQAANVHNSRKRLNL